MGDRAQILKCVTLFLKRIIRRGSAFDHDFLRLDLKRLFCLRCRRKCSGNDDRRTYVQLLYFLKIGECLGEDNL